MKYTNSDSCWYYSVLYGVFKSISSRVFLNSLYVFNGGIPNTVKLRYIPSCKQRMSDVNKRIDRIRACAKTFLTSFNYNNLQNTPFNTNDLRAHLPYKWVWGGDVYWLLMYIVDLTSCSNDKFTYYKKHTNLSHTKSSTPDPHISKNVDVAILSYSYDSEGHQSFVPSEYISSYEIAFILKCTDSHATCVFKKDDSEYMLLDTSKYNSISRGDWMGSMWKTYYKHLTCVYIKKTDASFSKNKEPCHG